MAIQPERSLASVYLDRGNALFVDTRVLEGFHLDHCPHPDIVLKIEVESRKRARSSVPSRSVRVTTGTADELFYVLSGYLGIAEHTQTFSTKLGEGAEFLALDPLIARIREAEEIWALTKSAGVVDFLQSVDQYIASLDTEWISGVLDKLAMLLEVFASFDEHHTFIYDLYSKLRYLFLTKIRQDSAGGYRIDSSGRKVITEQVMKELREFLKSFSASLQSTLRAKK